MNSIVKAMLVVSVSSAAALGVLLALDRTNHQDATTALAASSVESPSPGSNLGRTPEYDYDPPAPGTYKLPVLQSAEDGLVVGPNGKALHLHELLDGRVAILSFIYTRCSDPKACLRATGVLSQLHELSRQDPTVARNLTLITLSFDPGYDTPEVMERYGSVFRRGEGGAEWLFLTTRSQADLQPLLAAYGQRVDKRKKPSSLGPYQHTLKVYLIDPKARIRNIYSYGLLDPRLVLADVKTLVQEGKELAGSRTRLSQHEVGT
jgi:cytochrome oxidase Cu insertion factor (SCO1/SenC/PrrC family)